VKNLLVIFTCFVISTSSFAKDLKCELGIGLLKPKPANKVVVDFSYDDVAFNSGEPIDVSIGKIDFIEVQATEFVSSREIFFDELFNENRVKITGEKTVKGIWYSFEFIPKEQLLVHTKLDTKNVKDTVITMYECG
jgi:hypothetical protein